MRSVILLFAKAPVTGRVKTRLIPALGADGARELHERLVDAALARLPEVGDLILYTDEPAAAWPRYRGPRKLQSPGDLGLRMLTAIDEQLNMYSRVLIVGGDVPSPPLPALRRLLSAEADVALGPASDGGYYAIACRRTHPAMFDGVAWSSGSELRHTVEACQRAGLTVALGDPWFDIDTPEDLERAREIGIL